jgi:hypothetical protein
MKKISSRFLVAGLILAFAFDSLFYKKPFGISYFIWITLSVVLLVALSLIEKVKPPWASIALGLTSIGLSSGTFLRLEPFTRFISAALSLLVLMILAASYHYGYWIWYRLQDYVIQLLHLTGAALSRAWILIFPPKNQDEENSDNDGEDQETHKKARPVWPVLRGIALALPILFILSALLASADPIFNRSLKSFIDFFHIENLPEYAFRLIYILILAYFFSGVFIHAIYPNHKIEKPDPLKPWMKPFLGSVETTVVLSSINILFILFLMIQFRYFFGGQSNISAAGFTYSEYARKGFNELVAVAVISLLVYLAFSTITRKNNRAQSNLLTGLNIFLFIQVLVILVSGFQRLALYENAYGFSRLRTYSTLFIPWLAALVITVMILEIIRRQGYFALALLITGIGFVATFIIFNVDGFIARQNISRAAISSQEGYALDYEYLGTLSNDAVPAMLQAYSTTSGQEKDSITASLVCRWHRMTGQEKQPWQGFNLSENNAMSKLAIIRADLEQYPLEKNPDYPYPLVKINGEVYVCLYPDFDF